MSVTATRLDTTLQVLYTPIEVIADPIAVATKLEATRICLLKEAEAVKKAQQNLEFMLEE
jgi:hypothetical protein